MIKKITAKNFTSWKNLSFEVQNGITLIDGWNEDDQTSEGCGKSAVLNAIAWCIFGKIPKDANMDEVIKHGEKSCIVELEFSSGYKVVRSRKPNDLYIVEGEKTIKGKDARETQKLIEENVAKMSFDTFCQSIYFAQNGTKKFISANQEDRGKILSEIQDLNLFDKARKETQALIKVEDKNLVDLKHSLQMKQSELTLVETKIKGIDQMIEVQENQKKLNLQSIEQEIRSAHTSLESFKKSREQSELTLIKYRQDIQEIESIGNNEENLEGSIQNAMEERAVLVGQKSQIDNIKKTVHRKNQDGKRYAEEYKRLQAQVKELEKFIQNPTKDCPTCGTTLEQCDTGHAQEEVFKHQQRMTEIEATLTQLSKEINIEIPTSEQIDAQIVDKDGAIAGWRSQLSTLKNARTGLEKAQLALDQWDKNIEVQTHKLEIELANKYVTEKNRKIEVDTSGRDALKVQETEILQQIESMTNMIVEKDKHIAKLHTLKDGFKEIKSYVFNSALNEINARLDNYLQNLFNVPVSLKFINDNMKIGTQATINGNPQGLGMMSGGQFRRLSLATDLALSDVVTSRKGNSFNLLVLDEYFKDLSEQSMEKCLQLLERRNQPTILIEHNSIFKNIVNNSFYVHYEKETSSVKI